MEVDSVHRQRHRAVCDIAPGVDLTVALLDSPSLTRIRHWLVGVLDNARIKTDETHSFTPHISLMKQSSGDSAYWERITPLEFTFKHASLWINGESIKIPFRGGR